MGVVYKARQLSLNRFVALKLLAPERVHDPAFAERFASEAQALAKLNHPNIVTVHDFGQAGGYFYLLMEFVDGANLREIMHARKLSPAEALAIVPPLCDALQYAHDLGIVHRDIKPENLLVDKDGRVKVADFGIAKMLGADQAGTALAESNLVGTPQYMAPEQTKHSTGVDTRSDIYSLGVVFYEMLTGELPAKPIVAPSRVVRVDVRLDEIVLRALEQSPERRYQTAAELRTQVESFVSDPANHRNGHTRIEPGPRSAASSGTSGQVRFALGLLLSGILAAALLAALHRLDQAGLIFSGACLLLAFALGVASWRERMGKTCATVAVAIPLLAMAGWTFPGHPLTPGLRGLLLFLNQRAPTTELEGDWRIVSHRSGGVNSAPQSPDDVISFRGRQMISVSTQTGERVASTIRLAPDKSPRELDCTFDEGEPNERRRLFIYRFEGAQLILAFHRQDPARRPLGYVSAPENTIDVFTLERTTAASLEHAGADAARNTRQLPE
jgi:uncharacterized protein (TIGR03067 family)